jgi:hypothetical protein
MSNLDPGHVMEWKQKQKYHTLGHNSSKIQYKNRRKRKNGYP